METDGGQKNIEDIFKRHKLPYDTKIVEIGLVDVAEKLSACFPQSRTHCGVVAFRFLSKMDGGGGQVTIDDISRHHKLPFELKIVEIGLVVKAGIMTI
ncbi:hypothetical protein AVEN_159304-1 [Araneus ventricosus]|uniref:Uncharacterized protein n=1 Tax=Araneus ventricosus TaxID=182803 RepID=A0A4Y2A0H4_ARAVE|nr:hypothetical protein AVEN_159304-1 [Araneus ventricosus]